MRISFPKKLYHLSETNHNGKIFKPRVPSEDSRMDGEDTVHKRICVAGSIVKALTAIEACLDDEYYVHVPAKYPTAMWRPTVDQVPDVVSTHEIWIQEPVKMVCIGKLRVTSCPYYTRLYRWKWIEDNKENIGEY